MSSKQEYVLGFMFSEDGQYVVLIKKNKPEWQAGKLNGVGGKIESGEGAHTAMRREFLEETGVDHDDWILYNQMEFETSRVFCFYTYSDKAQKVMSPTDEYVSYVWIGGLATRNLLPNLRWLIPMAQSFKQGETAEYFVTQSV